MMMRLQVIMCNNNRIYTPINDLREPTWTRPSYQHQPILLLLIIKIIIIIGITLT